MVSKTLLLAMTAEAAVGIWLRRPPAAAPPRADLVVEDREASSSPSPTPPPPSFLAAASANCCCWNCSVSAFCASCCSRAAASLAGSTTRVWMVKRMEEPLTAERSAAAMVWLVAVVFIGITSTE